MSRWEIRWRKAPSNAGKKLGTPVEDSTVRALVSLVEDHQGGCRLAMELHAQLLGIDRPRFSAFWTSRTRFASVSKPCAATLPSSWWWTNQPTQPEGCENTFAVTLAANKNEKQNKVL
jgi:hypothetical protein